MDGDGGHAAEGLGGLSGQSWGSVASEAGGAWDGGPRRGCSIPGCSRVPLRGLCDGLPSPRNWEISFGFSWVLLETDPQCREMALEVSVPSLPGPCVCEGLGLFGLLLGLFSLRVESYMMNPQLDRWRINTMKIREGVVL